MEPISSNHWSHDMQVIDAMKYLHDEHPDIYAKILAEFPETVVDGKFSVPMDGSWIDTVAMGVEADWSSWLTDAIEDTGVVAWIDGEPWGIGPGEDWPGDD